MNKTYFILILLLSCLNIYPQDDNFDVIIKTLKHISSEDQSSTESLSRYIRENFSSKTDRLKAVYYWTATQIDYATEQRTTSQYFTSTEQLISRTMKSKRAVCHGFSEVFNELAIQLGFESYVVLGYTNQNPGSIRRAGHAWNAVRLDEDWYLFDPTWGAGHFLLKFNETGNPRYVKDFSAAYFMKRPEDFIRTHMPFDPIWQFRDEPISFFDFDQHRFSSKNQARMDHKKIIQQLPYLTEINQLQSSIERIESLGKGNSLVQEHLDLLKRNAEIAIDNQDGEKFNEAMEVQFKGIGLFNEYVDYFNHNQPFNASKIQKMNEILRRAHTLNLQAKEMYKKIETQNETMLLNLRIRFAELDELSEKISHEREVINSRKY